MWVNHGLCTLQGLTVQTLYGENERKEKEKFVGDEMGGGGGEGRMRSCLPLEHLTRPGVSEA